MSNRAERDELFQRTQDAYQESTGVPPTDRVNEQLEERVDNYLEDQDN